MVSTTKLQKEPKKVLSAKPMQILLTNNKISGMILSADLTEKLLDSDVLQQIREELWELQDEETVQMIRDARAGKKGDSIPFEEFRKKYGV